MSAIRAWLGVYFLRLARYACHKRWHGRIAVAVGVRRASVGDKDGEAQGSVCLIHRAAGVAINFVRNDDIRILRDIEQYYSTQIDEMVCRVWGADLVSVP